MTRYDLIAALLIIAAIPLGLCLLSHPAGLGVLSLVFSLVLGWFFYLRRTLPEVDVSRSSVVTALLCLAGLTIGLHWFLRWFFVRVRNDKEPGEPLARRWPVRLTVILLSIFILMFVAGIAAVGLVHQTGWLLASPEPLLKHPWDEGLPEVSKAIAELNWGFQRSKLSEAVKEYREEKGTLPPAAVFGPEGQPLLSWRVLLLPYLEEEELYREFHLDEPWDSPHNLRLLPRMPKVYSHPLQAQAFPPYFTHYQVLVGPGTAFEGPGGMRQTWDFPDGISNTILIAEAAEPVPWTKPADLPYHPRQPLPAFAEFNSQYFLVAFADGTIQAISRASANEGAIRAAITRNGDDGVSFEQW